MLSSSSVVRMYYCKKWALRSAILLLFLFSCGHSQTTVLMCNSNYYYGHNQCYINNLVIDTTKIASLKFPVQESITLENAQVDYLSKEVMERMKWVSSLTINNGRVERIYLKEDMQKLMVTGSNTFELIIDDERNDFLEELTITVNKLKTIPENMDKLKALTALSLKSNRIEVVDLNKLQDLEKLTSIDLSENRIYHIVNPETDWNLPRLKILDLSVNYLKQLDFNNWNLQRLQMLRLMSNHLTYLENLDESKFPLLRETQLYSNFFDCRWRDEFLPILKNITQSEVSLDCSSTTQLSTATYNRLNISDLRDGWFQFDSKEQLEEQINSIIDIGADQSKHIKSLKTSISYQAELIAEADKKLVAQQVLIDNLMARVEDLSTQMEQLKQQDALLASRSVSRGFTEKLIREISLVIRMNLQEEE